MIHKKIRHIALVALVALAALSLAGCREYDDNIYTEVTVELLPPEGIANPVRVQTHGISFENRTTNTKHPIYDFDGMIGTGRMLKGFYDIKLQGGQAVLVYVGEGGARATMNVVFPKMVEIELFEDSQRVTLQLYDPADSPGGEDEDEENTTE